MEFCASVDEHGFVALAAKNLGNLLFRSYGNRQNRLPRSEKRPIPWLLLAVGWVLIKLRGIFFAGVPDLSQEFEKQTINNSQVELDLVGAKLDDNVELPTLAIIFLVYVSWITLTYFFHEISLF